MAVLGTSATDRERLARRLDAGSHVVVVALCAAWCATCREFRETLETVGQARPDASIVWVDIEDDAELVGDVDIETFPTLALFEGEEIRHFGAVPPQAALVTRLIDECAGAAVADAPDEVVALVATLRADPGG